MDNHISSICRYCLEEREEFHHLALDCPALWWERHQINAQDPRHSSPERWTSQQILDFTMLPKVNEAFARPLYVIDMHPDHLDATLSQSQNADPASLNSDSDQSLMDISSASVSSSDSDNSLDSIISVD